MGQSQHANCRELANCRTQQSGMSQQTAGTRANCKQSTNRRDSANCRHFCWLPVVYILPANSRHSANGRQSANRRQSRNNRPNIVICDLSPSWETSTTILNHPSGAATQPYRNGPRTHYAWRKSSLEDDDTGQMAPNSTSAIPYSVRCRGQRRGNI